MRKKHSKLYKFMTALAIYLSAFAAFAVLSACGGSSSFEAADAQNPEGSSGGPEEGNIPPTTKPPVVVNPSPTPTPGPKPGDITICSELSLSGVSWPTMLQPEARNHLALALNISGSFEGPSGWANLTNNFDGMGLSMGLLNQTLGTGSLQPLWIKMRDRYRSKMQSQFTAEHFSSVLSMLSAYQNTGNDTVEQEDADPVNHLDEGQPEREDMVSSLSATSDSVAWAKRTLYTDGGTTFQTTWKNELKKMSASSEYVSLQIEAALAIHTKAAKYMVTLRLRELRSYLLLFDINVQNGGLYAADITDYTAYFASRPNATETEKLRKLLELRIRHVKSQWKNDVLTRKNSIINGTGTVHGESRNYEREYCFESSEKII